MNASAFFSLNIIYALQKKKFFFALSYCCADQFQAVQVRNMFKKCLEFSKEKKHR